MKIVALITIIALCGCENKRHKDLQDGLFNQMQNESSLSIKSLDKSMEFLRDSNFEGFSKELDEFDKHNYSNRVLYELWINDITKY